MLIMIVFDPLAVLLLIAANMTMNQKREGTPIVKQGEIVGLTPSDIPVFTDTVKSTDEFFQKAKKVFKKLDEDSETEAFKKHKGIWKKKDFSKVEIEKENIAEIEEPQSTPEPIVVDGATGETIPPLTVHIQEHVAPGVFHEWHEEVEEPSKKLEPKYDYDAEFAFREKENK